MISNNMETLTEAQELVYKYIHHYKGQKVQTSNGIGTLSEIDFDADQVVCVDMKVSWDKIYNIKPILHALEDIKSIQVDQVATYARLELDEANNWIKGEKAAFMDVEDAIAAVEWLLDEGFDVFRLIERGAAINAKTINL